MADETKNIVIKYISDTSGMAGGKKAIQDIGHEEDKIRAKVEATTASVREQGREFETTGRKAATGAKEAGGSMGNLNNLMKSGASLVAGYFAVDQLLNFGKQIINITAEFQKMNAVLKNTLGSQGAADNAMKMIADFAAKTPFSVKELTESFLKLANRGIKPTADMMRQLGDLAASQGKSFDDLTEAMLDAMTGEFERLKSFGITASSQGDMVAFSFKGVTTEVEKTDTAIKAYLQSLGELEGVTGSMAVISDTLSGKISNLGDNWDALLLTLGNGSSGIMTGAVDDLNGFLTTLTKSAKVMDMLTDGTRSFGEIMEMIFMPGGITKAIENEWTGGVGRFGKTVEKTIEPVGLLTAKTKELKQAQEDRDNATTREGVAAANIRIEKLKEEIAELHKLGQAIKTVPQSGIKILAPETLKDIAVAKDGIKEIAKEVKEIEDNSSTEGDKNRREYFAKLTQEWLEHNEEKVRIATDAAMAIGQLASVLVGNQIQANYEELDALEERYAREIELVGDNSRAKAELDRDYANKRAEIEAEIAEQKRKQAVLNKAMAITDIAIQTAVSIARVLAEVPKFDFGASTAVLIALYSALGSAQIATVAAQKIPKYKDGVLQLQGPGTETSDSIPALLSKGETVTSAEKTRKNLPLLKAIHEDRMPQWMVDIAEHNFDMARIGFGLPPELMAVQAGLDLSRVEDKLDRLNSTISGLPLHVSNFDESGFSRHITDRSGNRTYLLNRHT